MKETKTNKTNYKIITNGVQIENDAPFLLMEAVNDKQVLGYIRANINSFKNCLEFDTAVEPEHRGQGIATELLKAMLSSVFEQKAMDECCKKYGNGTETNKVVLNIDIDNSASRKVAERVKFKQTDSESRDSVEYSMTKQQYKALKLEQDAMKF